MGAVRAAHADLTRDPSIDAGQQAAFLRRYVDDRWPNDVAGKPRIIDPPALTFDRLLAIYNSASDNEIKIVVTLHGINTHGTWQKQITPWMGLQGWIHLPLDYGKYPANVVDWASFLAGHTRARLLHLIRDTYDEIKHDAAYNCYIDHVAVIAHSFGSKIVADSLTRYEHLLRFEKFIFCGSIVNADYDWDSLLKAGRIKGVLNEYGWHDSWTRAYRSLRHREIAGVTGFTSHSPMIVNRFRQVTHSDWFNRLQFETVWVPYLRTGLPPP